MANSPKRPNSPKQPILRLEAGTLVFIIAALILVPLLVTGFLAQ